MANEIRLRPNFVAGGLSADMASGATSMSSAGLADLPAVDTTNHAALTLWRTDVLGRVTQKEVIWVTAHTGGATTATVVRGREGTTAQNWSAGDRWSCSQLSSDVPTICTSSTRPTHAYNGMLIWETDSKRLLAYDGAAWQVQSGDTGWVNLTLINGWLVYDNTYGPSGYSGLATAPLMRRIGNLVTLRGLIRSGTLGSIVTVLPAGYRPGIKLLFTAHNSPNQAMRWDVEPGGNVIQAHAGGGDNVWASLNGITFIADN